MATVPVIKYAQGGYTISAPPGYWDGGGITWNGLPKAAETTIAGWGTCAICGAQVLDRNLVKHDKWHAALNTALEKVL